ncbi:fimbrial protein [Hafnia alvei]|uniref:fimbrial protein n=1 Tax=Hafnia alvei TaxID=569 RepID=UPI0013F159A3|nr:fimbrial protein [Hafnia alvei]
MKMNKLAVALVMTMGIASAAANAAGTVGGNGVIKFNGSIVDAACSIAPNNSDQTIDLGSIAIKALKDGAKSTPSDFHIKLTGCDVSGGAAPKASITFNGTSAKGSSNLLGIVSSTASGVGVGITDANGKDFELGKKTEVKTLIQGDNSLDFAAYVQATGASGSAITAGDFTSQTDFVITYN